jgi:hypothetical protein
MPSWLDFKTVLAICSVAIASSSFFWNWRRARRQLSYDYSTAPLFQEVTHRFSGRLAITLDGKQISNVSQVNIRIKNTGAMQLKGRIPIHL